MKHSFAAVKTALIMTVMALAGLQSCAPKVDTQGLPLKVVYVAGEASDRTIAADEDGMFNFKIPVGYIPKGGVIEFDAAVNTTASCSKYYVVECKSGNTWYKGDMFMCSGCPTGAGAHPSTILQTFRMPEPVKGELEIRFRPTGKEKADTAATDSAVPQMIMPKSYLAEYVQYLGNAVPKDTLNVLCVGNSFTYYWGCPAMLKEIA